MKQHLDVVNIPRRVCVELLGKNHRAHHRMAVGGAIMLVGVLVAQMGSLFEVWVIKVTCELVGYSFHGIGSVPLLEWLMDDKGGPPPSSSAVITDVVAA